MREIEKRLSSVATGTFRIIEEISRILEERRTILGDMENLDKVKQHL